MMINQCILQTSGCCDEVIFDNVTCIRILYVPLNYGDYLFEISKTDGVEAQDGW